MIPVAKPDLGAAEAEAAGRTILSGWVTQGPEVAAFENEFAATVGARHACAVSSCTTALHLALLAIGVQARDEVITVSHSYIATANAIRYCGATPVFVDIDPRTFNMDPEGLEAAITEQTKAILCVHQMGLPCDIQKIVAIAGARGLPVIEDAACAIGSAIRIGDGWERIGEPHGRIACFSFHPRKVITTGDGGMLTTSDAALDRMFRRWRQHDMNIPDTVRHGSPRVIFEQYESIGYNYRMTDIQAAVGRKQLERLEDIVERRRGLADRYGGLLEDIPEVTAPREPGWARSNWQSYCVRLPEDADQRAVMQFMLDRGVATRRGIMCAHAEPAYADVPLRFPLPQSMAARDQCVLLPLYTQMTDEDQAKVVDTLREALIVTRGSREETRRRESSAQREPERL